MSNSKKRKEYQRLIKNSSGFKISDNKIFIKGKNVFSKVNAENLDTNKISKSILFDNGMYVGYIKIPNQNIIEI